MGTAGPGWGQGDAKGAWRAPGLSLGSFPAVPAPGKGSPRCSGGVLWLSWSPDWYFSLDVLVFFQSSRFP